MAKCSNLTSNLNSDLRILAVSSRCKGCICFEISEQTVWSLISYYASQFEDAEIEASELTILTRVPRPAQAREPGSADVSQGCTTVAAAAAAGDAFKFQGRLKSEIRDQRALNSEFVTRAPRGARGPVLLLGS